ncbi:hypothetical protein DMENIID0001_011510 [Sergentomyia squamirostris]
MFRTTYDSTTKVWSGPENYGSVYHPCVTMGRGILLALNMDPDRTHQISADDDTRMTNREVYEATLKIAWNLQKRGCSKGDVIAIMALNSHHVTTAALAGLYLAAPVNGLDPNFTESETSHMLNMAEPKFIFCDNTVVKILMKVVSDLKLTTRLIVFGQKVDKLWHIDDFLEGDITSDEIKYLISCPPKVNKNDVSIILCSSGTTGLSKGILCSHEIFLKSFTTSPFLKFVERGNTILSYSTIYWPTYIITLLGATFCGATKIITKERFTPEGFMRIVQKYQLSAVIAPPGSGALLLKHPDFHRESLVSVKTFALIGSVVSSDLASSLQDNLPNGRVLIMYGMNELGSIAANVFEPGNATVGLLTAGVTAIIVNDETGQRLGVGEEGEICVKTSLEMIGYLKNEKAALELVDKDGWYHSGDVGFFDQDGCLHHLGRKKDCLKYNNYNIAPGDIEEIIEKHPDVAQVVVVGVPDPIVVDLPAAAVVKRAGSNITAEEIIKLVEDNVMDAKRLRGGVYFMNSLPMTPSGKIRKLNVKDMVIKLYNAKKSNFV